jgi:hypothetical protein
MKALISTAITLVLCGSAEAYDVNERAESVAIMELMINIAQGVCPGVGINHARETGIRNTFTVGQFALPKELIASYIRKDQDQTYAMVTSLGIPKWCDEMRGLYGPNGSSFKDLLIFAP